MANLDVTDLPATELARLVASREVSPVELTRAFLNRIERIDPIIRAFTTVTAELALARAEEAERSVARGDTELGPLHGVPISVKELSMTAGVRSTLASRAFEHVVPSEDSEHVGRLFRAGAIMLGKTNSPELGLNATTEDGLFPPTRNPWNPDHSAGGSSGGAGAALAARLCAFAQGSDGGGSIRIPAAACGVVGLKPGRGRVPHAPLYGEAWAGFATSGPMARTVADVALGLDVMAGPALGDPYVIEKPQRSFASAVDERPARLRVAWTANHPAAAVDPEVAEAVESTAQTLAELGHEVVAGMPDLSGIWEPFLTVVSAHTAATPVENPDLLGPNARASYDAGHRVTLMEYFAARQRVYEATRRILAWFEGVDVFVCPTVTQPPPPLGELDLAGPPLWERLATYIPFTFWVNVTGQPAISLPLAFSAAGLPIGVQLVGKPLGEHQLLALAAALERARPWNDRRPDIA